MILDILLSHPSTGYKRMKGYLLERRIKVTDLRVRNAMRYVDPLGVAQRTQQNRIIMRRVYYVQYSNQLWHIDANLKLIRYLKCLLCCATLIYSDYSTLINLY